MARKRDDFEALSEIIDYTFLDDHYLEQAFTHGSVVEKGSKRQDNRRLAFLGDAVIELALRESGLKSAPLEKRGKLSDDLDKYVADKVLAARAATLGLEDWLDMSPGEAKNELGQGRRLADVFEALAGAIYLDAGAHAFSVVKRMMQRE